MSPSRRSLTTILSSAAVLAAATTFAADWPQWRGPNGAGKADMATPAAWPKTLNQKWKLAVGEGAATPALVGDKLYVFSRENGNEVIRCLEADTSKEVWQDKYPAQGASGPAASFSGPRSSPAVADGKIVTLGCNGTLSCLDAATGKIIWRKNDSQGSVPKFFVASSPIITGGLVIAQVGGGNNGALVAYDLATGEPKWKAASDSPAYASPALMTVDGTQLIVAMTESKIFAVTMADGKEVWHTPFAAQGMSGYNAATPIVDGQTLIYSGGSRGTHAIQLSKDGDTFTGKELWANPDKSVQFNTPVLKDGMLYGLSQSNELFCLDAKTGKTAWGAPVAAAVAGGGGPGGPGGPPPGGPPPGGAGGAPPPGGGRPGGGRPGGRGGMGGGRGGGYGSIIDGGASLLALTPSSELIVFQPGDKYAEQAKIKVADSATYAYPVVSGNRVFIKDAQSLMLLTID